MSSNNAMAVSIFYQQSKCYIYDMCLLILAERLNRYAKNVIHEYLTTNLLEFV